MKLDEVTAEIRPRGKWESIDLGIALTQRNSKLIFLGWLLTVGPMMLVILILSYLWYNHQPFWYNNTDVGLIGIVYSWLPIFLVWWFKPLFDRVPLYILSRSLFGEQVSIFQLITTWPKMLYKGWFDLLVKRRISTSRSFTLPIYELEGLRGRDFKKRVDLLSRSGGEGASSLTISSKLIGTVLIFSGYVTFRWLMMYGFNFEEISYHVGHFFLAAFGAEFNQDSITPMIFVLISYMFTVSILSPFYAGAGFALYINSRTISEGWDIELAFKRMSQRLADKRKLKSHTLFSFIAILGITFVCIGNADAQASQQQDMVQTDTLDEIETIMASEELELKVIEIEDKELQDFNSNLDLTFLGHVFQFLTYLFIIAVAALLIWLIYLIVKNLGYTKKSKTVVVTSEATPAKTVLGMNITPESLPDDIVQAARDAWNSGNKKLALSILYRGSLEWMVNTAKLPIIESDTEQDCVIHCKKVDDVSLCQYFDNLTVLWVGLAYGKEEPKDGEINWLTGDYPFHKARELGSKEVNS